MLAPISATALRLVIRVRDDESGQGLTEYTFILVLIAIIAIVALTFFGGNVTTVLSSTSGSI